ncbi:MAG: hypothetical protein QMC83_04985 [Thermodesulfovibrionales bacterium]|nr:hypothetical protein [Thermodesulfovibrionales bacterium]
MKKSFQREIKDLSRIYNLSPAISASIIPLREAESRGLILDLGEPHDLASMISGYDALFSTGLSKDYIDKRGFNLFISLRELLQNALDEEEMVTGKPYAQLEQDSLGTWIMDRGRGITLEALRMGESNKECWLRGYYGEGLKLAASYLTLNQIPVYIFTQNMVFRFKVLPQDAKNPGIFILLGRAKEEVKGTRILLAGYRPDPEFIKKMVRFRNNELEGKLIAKEKFFSEDCPKKMPSAIFDFPNLLYIRNMYVGEMSQVAKRKSLLSYDLWWVRLDVSRKLMTQTTPQLFLEIAKLLELSAVARRKFVEKLVETGMLKKKPIEKGFVIEFMPIFSIVEGHLFVYAFPDGMLDAFADVLGLAEKRDLIRRVTSHEEVERAISQGLIPLLLPYEISDRFSSIPSL